MLHEIDLSRTDLNLLVLFEAVFAERHVGRAAERLTLSPSAVSHGLGRLRRMLNDPVFLKTPKGVIPTERAEDLAPAIAAVLQQTRGIVAQSEPFNPANSTRRFVIGAPDGVSAVFLHPLLAQITAEAPGLDIGIRQLLPAPDEIALDRAWRGAFADLETRALDVAVIPIDSAPLRFAIRTLYNEDFVLAMRPDHAFLSKPSLESYCDSGHLVVSLTGDPKGFVDEVLAREGRSRRVQLTVPNFMFACAILAETDLICAIPRRFAMTYAARFGLVIENPPLPLGSFRLSAFVPKAALSDDGVAWLLKRLEKVGSWVEEL